MTAVAVIVTIMIGVAVLIAIVRLAQGPTMLDRMVALEVVVACLLCGLGVIVAYTGSTTLLGVLVSLALLSFIGAVAVARFAAKDPSP